MRGPVPGTAAHRLWNLGESQSLAKQALMHPFVIGIGNGSAPIASFRNYIAQDYFFLGAFIKAYALVLSKVDDNSSKRTLHELIGAVIEELEMHEAYAAGWGVDTSNEAYRTPNAATTKYVDFLLHIARGDSTAVSSSSSTSSATSVAETIAAMVPCMRLYSFLGQTLNLVFKDGKAENAYREWIDTYSQFEEATEKIEDLLNFHMKRETILLREQGGNSLSEEFLQSLETNYVAAMKLEVEFFDAQVPLDVHQEGTSITDAPPTDRDRDISEARERIFNSLQTCTLSDS